MTEPNEKSVLSGPFVEAMKRVEALRTAPKEEPAAPPTPPEKQRLLRRSFLIQRDFPERSRCAIILLGELHGLKK